MEIKDYQIKNVLDFYMFANNLKYYMSTNNKRSIADEIYGRMELLILQKVMVFIRMKILNFYLIVHCLKAHYHHSLMII